MFRASISRPRLQFSAKILLWWVASSAESEGVVCLFCFVCRQFGTRGLITGSRTVHKKNVQ